MPLALAGYEMLCANSGLGTSLAISKTPKHFRSRAICLNTSSDWKCRSPE